MTPRLNESPKEPEVLVCLDQNDWLTFFFVTRMWTRNPKLVLTRKGLTRTMTRCPKLTLRQRTNVDCKIT